MEEVSERCTANIDGETVALPTIFLPDLNMTNNTNLTEEILFSPYFQHSLGMAAVFVLAYLFIFLLCMIGNSVLCLIVLKKRHMWTVTNVFILNLSISDLLVGIFCIPTTLVDNLITGKCIIRKDIERRTNFVQMYSCIYLPMNDTILQAYGGTVA